jgi:PASTA domain
MPAALAVRVPIPAGPVTPRRRGTLGWLAAAVTALVLLLGAGTAWQLNRTGHDTPAAASTGHDAPESGSATSGAAGSDSPSVVPSTAVPATPSHPTRTGRSSGAVAPKLYKVPRVLGYHEAEARQALLDAGFPNVAVTHTFNPGLTPGFVIDCQPSDGTYASPSTTIRITVTIPDPSPSPSPSPPGW